MANGSHLAQHFFGKPLAGCPVAEVQAAAMQYPFVGPLQLLLLAKLQPGTDAYTDQYERCLLHFPTPAHLYFALHTQADVATEAPAAITEPQAAMHPGPQLNKEMPGQPFTDAPPLETPALLPAADGIISPQTQPETAAIAPTLKPEPADALSFEPYHTVDYFASQGIKLSKEEVGTDKFGKQLKSFTEWLKTMKRLPPNAPPAATDAPTEKGVNNLAERSVADAQVLTESMAEVWQKQGALDKATEVYRKLSLLHPSKRAYFAAKIEALKDKK